MDKESGELINGIKMNGLQYIYVSPDESKLFATDTTLIITFGTENMSVLKHKRCYDPGTKHMQIHNMPVNDKMLAFKAHSV